MAELFEDSFEWDPNYGQQWTNHEPEFSAFSESLLASWTDEELLETPADRIAQTIREMSLDGRDYVAGDVAPTTWAVVRVPDHEAMMEDFKPRLDWSDHVEVEVDEPGLYPINMTLDNRSIAPRIVEPSLPNQTKIACHDLHGSDIPMPPLEKALFRGAQTIQLIQKAGGEHQEIAKALGRLWGDEELFDPDNGLDLLGDISLPRVLARAGKRRFETLRNIGWTSIVTAGMTTANPKSYGDSAVINWQRRTELAKFFLHTAIALEGKELQPGQQFGITARIPAFSVNHRTWDDLAIYCDSSMVQLAILPDSVLDRARNFLRLGLRNALVHLSAVARSRGDPLEWTDQDFLAASAYDRLVYLDTMTLRYQPTANIRAFELAQERAKEDSQDYQGSFKAHDARTALLEMMYSSENFSGDVMRVSSMVNEVIRYGSNLPTKARASLSKAIVKQLPLITRYAAVIANRPKHYELRSRRAEWGRIALDQFPAELLGTLDAYTSRGIALGTLFTALSDTSSQVSRTFKHNHSEAMQILKNGIRSKKQIVISVGKTVIHQLLANLVAATKSFYRERYRARATALLLIARESQTQSDRLAMQVRAINLWLRADAAHYTALLMDDPGPRVALARKRHSIIMAIYASHLRKKGMPDLGSFKGLQWSQIRERIQQAFLEWYPNADPDLHPSVVFMQIDKYVEELNSDIRAIIGEEDNEKTKPEEVWHEAIENEQDLASLLDISNRPRNLATKSAIDDMISTWVMVGGLSDYVEADTVDELVDWVKANIERYVDDVENYCATHSKDLTEKMASDLYDEWDERKELDEGELAAANELA